MASPNITKDISRHAGILRLGGMRIVRVTVSVLFVACLLVTLTAGLWPFSSPRNDAAWLPNSNGIRFNSRGTAISHVPLILPDAASRACSVEVWLQPATMWTTGTPVSFYNAQTKRLFAIKQEYIDLVLQLADPERPGSAGSRSFMVPDVFRRNTSMLAITSDGRKTSIYADGRLLAESPDLALSNQDLSGRLILGNAPLRNHSWQGVVSKIAVYSKELSAQQVLENYRDRAEEPQSATDTSDGLRALYLFQERSGRVIHDALVPAVNLEIPKNFITVDQLHFERPNSEARADGHYRDDAIINVAGFIPLGFVAALFFGMFYRMGRAVILSILVGAATSFTIEYFQAYLPTRYSGVTDLMTNPLGAGVGALLYCAAAKIAAKKIGAKRFSRLTPNHS